MADNRYDLSVTKANMEYAAEVAKDKRLTGDRYKISTVDPAYGPAKNSSHARYDTPRTPLEFDIENINMFKYDMDHCIKCKGCYWVDHTYMPGMKHAVRCPSNLWKEFDSYGAFGKMRIGLKINEGEMEWTDHLLELIYADPLCGACDVGCKRNLDLEVGLTLEALRVKAVKDGAGPMPAHKKIAANTAETGNCYGAGEDRRAWVSRCGAAPAEKADIMYFAGCASSYENTTVFEDIFLSYIFNVVECRSGNCRTCKFDRLQNSDRRNFTCPPHLPQNIKKHS